MNTPEEICNLANSRLGHIQLVASIDSPQNVSEKAYAKWYDVCRQDLLKTLMPNFAVSRRVCGQLEETPAFGWTYAYEYPTDCLKALGIGEVQAKENNYAVERLESGDMAVLSDENYEDGMELRFIADVTDVAKFSPEFSMMLSWVLAYNACIEITKDYDKLAYIEKVMPMKLSASSAVNAQESRPVRINTSKFKQARNSDSPTGYVKR
jgi:hypothetical protein